ncbi:cytochrome c [Rhodovulum sp. 12E13]|uniref:c-type cytochrome n=1 Tax=Rhodovulum sp. 12E13 TaxID=2203891 RepID=UPI000E1338E1|nr:cytochrome c [Rhodovulum sp. 12E13]RDC71069.1 cytochrome c [Rhodovulum sp. 12E13]
MTRFPFRTGARTGALVVAACLAAPLSAPAQEAVGDPQQGAALYDLYCATCHGAEGRGDGPTAEIMTLQPADLTALSAGNGGVFPTARVVRQIDGRDPVLAHGSPMPVFGPFFEGEDTAMKTPAGQPVLTSRPVADLVAWLMAIQEGS